VREGYPPPRSASVVAIFGKRLAMTNPIAREPDEAMALRVLAQRERDLGFTAYADWLDAGCPASFEWPYPQEKLDEILFYARAMEATKDRETASPASEAFIDAVQSAQTKLDDLRASLNGDAFGGSRLSIFATDLEALLSAACRAPTAASPTPRDTLADPDDLVQIAEAVAFYADPENWHGVYMMGEGPMADDWNETADPQYSPKPGKRAREALVAWEAALASSASQRG
jgi:hypothetical protein